MSLWEGLEDMFYWAQYPMSHIQYTLAHDHWWVFSQNVISYDNATNITFMLTIIIKYYI